MNHGTISPFVRSLLACALVPVWFMPDKEYKRTLDASLSVEAAMEDSWDPQVPRAELGQALLETEYPCADVAVWCPLTPTPLPIPTPIFTPMDVPIDTSERVAPLTTQGKCLVVDQSRQVMHVYEDGSVVRSMPVSTGAGMLYTPAFTGEVGRYVETLYGFGSFMDHAWYITRAGGDIYLHGAPYVVSGGDKVYEDLELLGVRPSSHGCIRVHPYHADWLASWGIGGVAIWVTSPDLEKWNGIGSADSQVHGLKDTAGRKSP